MKAKIIYVREQTYTKVDNPDLSFTEFCKELFKARIYVSTPKKGRGAALAINTDNVVRVEEIE